MIGKKDLETDMLIPNARYFEIFEKELPSNEEKVIIPKSILDFGNNFILDYIAE